MKLVIVKGEFAGQERRGWFPALTGKFNLTGKSDFEASATEDPEKLDWLVNFASNMVAPYGEVRVIEADENGLPLNPSKSLKFLN